VALRTKIDFNEAIVCSGNFETRVHPKVTSLMVTANPSSSLRPEFDLNSPVLEIVGLNRSSGRTSGAFPVRSVAVFLMMMIGIGGLCGDNALMGDWPQINGPQRNGVATNEKLLAQWPKELNELWSHPIGQGYAGPVVVQNRVIVFHRPAKKYLVESLNAETGELIWNKQLDAEFPGGMDGDKGPKSIPLVHDGNIYLVGAEGKLFCLRFDDGELIWQKDLLSDYPAQSGYFGVGATPIAIGKNLICNVGGRDAGVVAFDLKTGVEAWKAFDDRASYSSPIAIQRDGIEIAVFITRLNLVGLNATNGKVVFQSKFGKSGPTVNGAMPVRVTDDGTEYLFASAAYGVGAKLWKLPSNVVEEIWANDTSYSSQFSTPVIRDGFLFGTSGREDHNNGAFCCVDVLTGQAIWKRDRMKVGHSILVGDKILLFETSGGLHVIDADKTKFKREFQAQLFDSTSFAMPALSDGLLYARSNAGSSGSGELVCVEVGKRTSK